MGFKLSLGWRLAAKVLMSALVLGSWAVNSAQAQFAVSDSVVGYIDSAIPSTYFRLRFDAAYGSTFPDRAEFQYAKYNNPGPPLTEVEIDSQEVSAYFEYAPVDRLSFFAELPVRWINPERNQNTAGLYDMNAGVKLAVYQDDAAVLSLQFRTYAATGDTSAGLSTGHASLEPAILYFHQVSERLKLEGELRDWIPIDASQTGPGGSGGGGGGGGGGMGMGGSREFGGNVLRYGLGLGYLLHECQHYSATSVTEVVGWHVLDGLQSTPDGQRVSAKDDAIVNLKQGLRFGLGNDLLRCGDSTSFYVGYGVALTDDKWYNEILRAELRWVF